MVLESRGPLRADKPGRIHNSPLLPPPDLQTALHHANVPRLHSHLHNTKRKTTYDGNQTPLVRLHHALTTPNENNAIRWIPRNGSHRSPRVIRTNEQAHELMNDPLTPHNEQEYKYNTLLLAAEYFYIGHTTATPLEQPGQGRGTVPAGHQQDGKGNAGGPPVNAAGHHHGGERLHACQSPAALRRRRHRGWDTPRGRRQHGRHPLGTGSRWCRGERGGRSVRRGRRHRQGP